MELFVIFGRKLGLLFDNWVDLFTQDPNQRSFSFQHSKLRKFSKIRQKLHENI